MSRLYYLGMARDQTYLNEIAEEIDDRMPEGKVFIFLSVDVHTGGRVEYVSNMERTSAINCLKEWLLKCSAHEDWMKHLK